MQKKAVTLYDVDSCPKFFTELVKQHSQSDEIKACVMDVVPFRKSEYLTESQHDCETTKVSRDWVIISVFNCSLFWKMFLVRIMSVYLFLDYVIAL